MSRTERTKFLQSLSNEEAAVLFYDWRFWARPEQIAPEGDWHVWMVMAGRGFGKTRTGAEWVRERVEQGFKRIALVGSTAADVRDVMIEGESGLLNIYPPHLAPRYEPSKRRVTWQNGAMATCYSGDEPAQLRGPQHDTAWIDEPQKWRYGVDAIDNLELGLRLGIKPQLCATCTPLPTKLIRSMIADPGTVLSRGSTYDNAVNLAPTFIDRVIKKYEGTVTN